MGVKDNVFASKSERQNFLKLSRRWGDNFQIYHNLPFLSVFDKENLFDLTDPFLPEPYTVSQRDFQRLKKTSIDYTICHQDDKPILCIEFDGLQQGFSHGVHYHTDQPSKPWRKTITELKLKVARGSFFEFIVVGSNVFRDIDRSIQISIVDGIIGEVIARRLIKEKLATGAVWEEYGYTEDEFNKLDSFIQQELIEDYVIGVEVSTQQENNPIWQKSGELALELQGYYKSWSPMPVEYPPIDHKLIGVDRIRAMQQSKLVGTAVTLHTEVYGDIVGQVMVPNYGSGAIFSGLTQELAFIQALLNLKKVIMNRSR